MAGLLVMQSDDPEVREALQMLGWSQPWYQADVDLVESLELDGAA